MADVRLRHTICHMWKMGDETAFTPHFRPVDYFKSSIYIKVHLWFHYLSFTKMRIDENAQSTVWFGKYQFVTLHWTQTILRYALQYDRVPIQNRWNKILRRKIMYRRRIRTKKLNYKVKWISKKGFIVIFWGRWQGSELWWWIRSWNCVYYPLKIKIHYYKTLLLSFCINLMFFESIWWRMGIE